MRFSLLSAFHMSDPLLSFVVPVYNVERYLTRCLDSIFESDVDSSLYEVLAIDDCSSDGSYDVLCQYAGKHSNLKIFRHDVNLQIGETRNEGIRRASGAYIWFVDSDDCIMSDKLPLLLSMLEAEELDLLVFNFLRVDGMLKYRMPRHYYPSSPEMCGTELYVRYHPFSAPWNKIYRRTMLTNNELFFVPCRLPEDQDWLTGCYLHARKARMVNLELYLWSVTPDSLSNDVRKASKYVRGFTSIIEDQVKLIACYDEPRFWVHIMFALFSGYNARVWQALQNGILERDEYVQCLRWEKDKVAEVLRLLPIVFCREYCFLRVLRSFPDLFIRMRNLVRRFHP